MESSRERSNRNMHNITKFHKEGKTSANSNLTAETKKTCSHHHAINCNRCPGHFAVSAKRQLDFQKRMIVKKEFSEKVKQFKGKNISTVNI